MSLDARALLEKFGWKEGDGLGKDSQGISVPIRPKTQMKRSGLGMDEAKSLVDPWWANVFNKTAKGVVVTNVEKSSDKEKGRRGKKRRKNVEEAARQKKRSVHLEKKYDYFVKPATVLEATEKEGGLVEFSGERDEGVDSSDNSYSKVTPPNPDDRYGNFVKAGNTRIAEEPEKMINPIDTSLWRGCEERTCHKGARHGALKGKMHRVNKQENQWEINKRRGQQ